MTNDTIVRLVGKLPKPSSLDGHADDLYRHLGKRYMAVCEFVVADRTEVDPSSEASPKVKLVMEACEIAYHSADDEEMRKLQRRIFTARTDDGTFDSLKGNGEVSRDPFEPTTVAQIPKTGAARPRRSRATTSK